MKDIHKVFFFLTILLLPTQLGLHFWPDWSMIMGRRVDYLAPTVYLTDILLMLTVGSWILSKISSIKYQISNIHSKYQKWKYLLVPFIFALFVGANIFQASNTPVVMYKWLKVGEFVALGWYIVKTRPSLSTVVTPLSIGVLYSSILAIAQFFLQHSIGGPLWWIGERTFTIDTPGIARIHLCQLSIVNCQLLLRPYATFPHPNVLGGYLATLLPLIINLQIIKSTNKQINEKILKIFKWTTLVLGIIALGLTFGRSAIAVGVVAILVTIAHIKYQILKIKKAIRLLLLPGIFALSVVLVWFVVQSFQGESESIVVRQQLNAAAITLWQRSPLFGVGLGNFLVRLPEVLESRSIFFLQPVHNVYLLVLAETGVVGFIGVIWLLWESLNGKREVLRRSTTKQALYALRFTLIALLLLGLVDHYPLTVQQGQLLLTVFVALSYASLPSSS